MHQQIFQIPKCWAQKMIIGLKKLQHFSLIILCALFWVMEAINLIMINCMCIVHIFTYIYIHFGLGNIIYFRFTYFFPSPEIGVFFQTKVYFAVKLDISFSKTGKRVFLRICPTFSTTFALTAGYHGKF